MYKVLAWRASPLRRLSSSVLRKNGENYGALARDCFRDNIQLRDRCKACVRFKSTITHPIDPKLQSKGAKVKEGNMRNTRFCDLLAEVNSSVLQQKTSVRKFSWEDLQLLASTNLSLNELHKIKQMPVAARMNMMREHTYNNLSVIGAVPEPVEGKGSVITCDIPDILDSVGARSTVTELPEDQSDAVEDVMDLPPGKAISPFRPEAEEDEPEEDNEAECCSGEHAVMVATAHPPKKKEKKASISAAEKRKKREEEEAQAAREAKGKVGRKTLAAYVEMCANLRSPRRAYNSLFYHNHRAENGRSPYFTVIRDIRVYNAIMKGFAAKKDAVLLEDVVACAKKYGAELNVQSYVAILECYGRLNSADNSHTDSIRQHLNEARKRGITFNKIVNGGAFLFDQREVVLGAIRAVEPKYNPRYAPPSVQYDNVLVNGLNHPAQLNHNPITSQGRFVNRGGLFTPERLEELMRQQLKVERLGHVVVKSVEAKQPATEKVLKYRALLNDLYKSWEDAATAGFQRVLNNVSSERGPLNPEPYIRCIPAKDFVQIVVEEAKKIAVGSESYSPTVNVLFKSLGSQVYSKYKALRLQKTKVLDKIAHIHTEYCHGYAYRHPQLHVLPKNKEMLNPRQMWQWAEHSVKHLGATLETDHREWNHSILITIGELLYRIIIKDLMIDVNTMKLNSKKQNHLPAFYMLYRSHQRKLTKEVKPHPVVARLYRAAMPETLTFPAEEVPMRCPPVPWTSTNNGGYLLTPCELVRMPSFAMTQKKRLKESNPVHLYPALDSLNQLAAVPWRINTDVFDIILDVFSKGGSAELDVPQPPSSLPPPEPEPGGSEKVQFSRKYLQYYKKQGEMYSLWCDCLYKLSLANHFRDEIFWLPHNMDFRGRVYPVPPHLNHLGSDLARSMLMFAEARPLGPEGLNWLKIHAINLTGLKKKESIAARLAYADDILDDILDSADNPLTGRKWWVGSDEPWQTLACCIEIAKAVRSPDHTKYRSHFPVHQDGSCNGLQHYAALGRDTSGAFSVNLCPSERPQDVYSAVVSLVENQRIKDAENGNETAIALEGFVQRKVIKQTIMTTVYGVTRYGARLQIARQLKDQKNFPQKQIWAASTYLTARTFESLRAMFTSAKEIQDWFTECARVISGVAGQHVEWVTPLGLPVVQPYVKHRHITNTQTMVYKNYHMDQFEKPNTMKHKNAFPPNFVHSLDSSHMMLTSLFSEREGITFVSVHDCYWTHPSTVHIMNRICREQFVALHSQPILDDLATFFSKKYGYNQDHLKGDGSKEDFARIRLNRVLVDLPKTGEFDINQVLDSTYFFS